MNGIKSLVCAAVAIAVLTIAPAVYSGLRSHRWQSTDTLRHAALTLDALPQDFGPWTCLQSAALDEEAQKGLKYEAGFNRTYSNQNNSTTINCILIVGLPGPIVRHPPEFCYKVRDYVSLEHKIVTLNSGNIEHAFRVTRYQESRPLKQEFFVATGYFANGRFGTSEFPRMTYGAEPFIYAIQVAWPVAGDLQECEVVGISFLKDLVPEFQEYCVKPVAAIAVQ